MTMALIAVLAIGGFALRIWGVQNRFWMLEDQIRDWGIALGPLSSLPLTGPPTHVHGYTIGPAFYWILWCIRVVLGPFFDNLPHAGGIGQAALQTAADTLLLIAIWRRTGRLWLGIATFIVVVTSAYEMALSALVWNPTMGATLAKAATALVLLNWHRKSRLRLAIVAAIAWASIHAYTGATFVALAVLLALSVDTLRERGWIGAVKAIVAIAVAVAALQTPYVIHQFRERFSDPAMSAVSGDLSEVLTGKQAAQWEKSVTGFRSAIELNVLTPWTWPPVGWLVFIGAVATTITFWSDPILLIVLLLPQLGAIVGLALFLGTLDGYYYLSVTPAVVLSVLLPLSKIRWRAVEMIAAAAVLIVAVVTIPKKVAASHTIHQLPEYRTLVSASRVLKNLHRPFRVIVADFPLPPTSDSNFPYVAMGGEIDLNSPWVAVVSANGQIKYINNDERR